MQLDWVLQAQVYGRQAFTLGDGLGRRVPSWLTPLPIRLLDELGLAGIRNTNCSVYAATIYEPAVSQPTTQSRHKETLAVPGILAGSLRSAASEPGLKRTQHDRRSQGPEG